MTIRYLLNKYTLMSSRNSREKAFNKVDNDSYCTVSNNVLDFVEHANEGEDKWQQDRQ